MTLGKQFCAQQCGENNRNGLKLASVTQEARRQVPGSPEQEWPGREGLERSPGFLFTPSLHLPLSVAASFSLSHWTSPFPTTLRDRHKHSVGSVSHAPYSHTPQFDPLGPERWGHIGQIWLTQVPYVDEGGGLKNSPWAANIPPTCICQYNRPPAKEYLRSSIRAGKLG